MNALLNVFDGVGSKTGCLFGFTTNYLDRIDPALIRPGRCDVFKCLDLATRDQIRKMARNFYPDEDPAIVEKFAQCFQDKTVSPAAIQGHLLKHDTDADSLQCALDHVDEVVPCVARAEPDC